MPARVGYGLPARGSRRRALTWGAREQCGPCPTPLTLRPSVGRQGPGAGRRESRGTCPTSGAGNITGCGKCTSGRRVVARGWHHRFCPGEAERTDRRAPRASDRRSFGGGCRCSRRGLLGFRRPPSNTREAGSDRGSRPAQREFGPSRLVVVSSEHVESETPQEGSTTTMKSGLEIAQEAELRPIADIAAAAGIEPGELEQYGRYRAKIDPSILDRLAGRPDGKLVITTAITPTKAGEGQDHDERLADAGARQDRQGRDALPARAVDGPGLGHQGRRQRRRLRAGRADGGVQPALQRRLPRGERRAQPARRPRSTRRSITATRSTSIRNRSPGRERWT